VIDGVEVPPVVHLWVGDTRIEIAQERFEHAVRLSMGPEIDAINVLLRGLSILIQDDLEVLSLDQDPLKEDELRSDLGGRTGAPRRPPSGVVGIEIIERSR